MINDSARLDLKEDHMLKNGNLSKTLLAKEEGQALMGYVVSDPNLKIEFTNWSVGLPQAL